MRYSLKQIQCRPWTLNGLSLKLIESGTAVKLKEAGFNARYMNSGHMGWKAMGGPVKMFP